MPKKDRESGEIFKSETGNWNSASDFSREKIMKPLVKVDYYEDIAKFGYQSIIEELQNFSVPDDLVRYTALCRLVEELLKLCKNTKFAMKKLTSKNSMERYEKNLKKIRDAVLPNIKKIRTNASSKTSKLKLDQEKFKKTLDVVLDLKEKINIPLNLNDLIFVSKEEFDPIAFKDRIKHRIVNKG